MSVDQCIRRYIDAEFVLASPINELVLKREVSEKGFASEPEVRVFAGFAQFTWELDPSDADRVRTDEVVAAHVGGVVTDQPQFVPVVPGSPVTEVTATLASGEVDCAATVEPAVLLAKGRWRISYSGFCRLDGAGAASGPEFAQVRCYHTLSGGESQLPPHKEESKRQRGFYATRSFRIGEGRTISARMTIQKIDAGAVGTLSASVLRPSITIERLGD